MKQFFLKYKHALPVFIYMAIYLTWFFFLEHNVTDYRIIHTSIDDKIPFCEFFVIPYFLWFLYVPLAGGIAFFTDKDEYFKTLEFLFTGMTIFLLVSTLWPNGQNLRPVEMPRDNVFSRMVLSLYSTDTPTNLWPSIHVFNSIGGHLCISRCKATKDNKWIKLISLIICISIILSTMFIKQHSLFDVCTAFAMAMLLGLIVYRQDLIEYFREVKERRELEAEHQFRFIK